MKQGIFERLRTRREIRRLNREVSTSPSQTRNGLICVSLVVIATVFIVFEAANIVHSEYRHDQNLVVGLANEASVELNMINTSLIIGDQTMFKNAYQQYSATLDQLNRNSYMEKEQGELLRALNDYQATLARETNDAHLVKLRTSIKMLQSELNEVSLEKVSIEDMIAIKEAFEDFRDSLSSLDDERFAKIVVELTEYSDRLIELIDKTSVCIGACGEDNLKKNSGELEKVLDDYDKKLNALDAEVSSYYSPSALAEALKMLQ